MARKRVHEIAKEQGLTSKEVLAKLKAAGIEAKVAASSVEEADALAALGNGAAPAAGEAKAEAPAKAAKAKTTEAKDDKPGDAGAAADRSRSDPHQLGLYREGDSRVARRRGARGDQEADEPGGDGHAHPDPLGRGARGPRGGVRQEDRDRPRGRRRGGRADLRGRRGGPARAPTRGDHHGPRRPRQDLTA